MRWLHDLRAARWRGGGVVAAAALTAATVSALAPGARAISTDDARQGASGTVTAVRQQIAKLASAPARRKRVVTPARRLAEGEILLANRDYERASHVLNQLLELHRQGKVPDAVHAEAVVLLAEVYYQSDQFLSARRLYRQVLDKAGTRQFSGAAGRALSRLVDLAIRGKRPEDLDYVFARLDRLPATDATGAIAYAKGKAYLARGRYESAIGALRAVPPQAEWGPQAMYVLALIEAKRAAGSATEGALAAANPPTAEAATSDAGSSRRFVQAIERFRAVTRLPAKTPAHRKVIDLAWMAIGRLFYESENYLDAAEAYSHVDRKSSEFSTMLFELAWVYVRIGDFVRAQRSLEVLSVLDPKSLKLADGNLLRADLLLRSGQFRKALALYKSVRGRFDPVKKRLDDFLSKTSDPAVYYDKLTTDDLEGASGDNPLPPMITDWAREEASESRVFAVIDDVNRSRKLLRKSQRTVRRLRALMASGTRVKAFPKVLAQLEAAVGMLNQLTQARALLSRGLDSVVGDGSGDLASTRGVRRKMLPAVDRLPTSPAEFSQREATSDRRWNKLSQKLHRLTLSADRLQALVNGLSRVMREADQNNVNPDPTIRARFQREIESNHADLAVYRKRIKAYGDALEMGRLQVGFGDTRTVADRELRDRFRRAVNGELALVKARESGAPSTYVESIGPLLARLRATEQTVEALRRQLMVRVKEESGQLERVLDEESGKIRIYAERLDRLDDYARLVVGRVAMENFQRVRLRLQSVVLRADVGVVQEAWENRVEQQRRLIGLRRERAREVSRLDEELKEVLDDGNAEEN